MSVAPFVPTSDRLLTEPDFTRLQHMGAGRLPAELADLLDGHDLVARDDTPGDLVTLDSEVELRDQASGRLIRVKLCDPGLSNPTLGYVSVLSPLGLAILGLRVGMVACWPLPTGAERSALIERITFQPEAQRLAPVG
jgi:regulator of nucleoside diphosphate kinase